MRLFASGIAALLLAPSLAGAQAAQAGKTDPEIKHPWQGDFKDDYKDPKTKALVMHYRMRAPEKKPEQKHLGLIVAFHGMNGNEDHVTGWAIEAAKRVGIVDQYVIMGGKSKGAGWASSDDKDLLAWIAWAKETYPIDPRRVHIVGMSNGGWMVKRFGWEHQDLFASISPYCGGGVDFGGTPKGQKAAPAQGPLSPAETKLEWYYVHGDADKEVGVDSSRRACTQLKDKGYRYVYREIAGADHGGILRYPEVADDNLRFMHALRHKEMPLSKDERANVTSIANKAKNEKADAIGPLVAEAARVGGAPGGKVVGNAFDNSDAEVKKAAAGTTETTLYGRETVMELIKQTKDKSEEVKAAAYKGLAVAANWRYAEAQEYCAQVARKKSGVVEERLLAIQVLGRAVRLQLLGNLEDKTVIQTLVLCLDDDELKVRETAFAQLEKFVKDTFEYKPDLGTTERKTSVKKWQAWVDQKAGASLSGGQGAK
jgi:predicted esterase